MTASETVEAGGMTPNEMRRLWPANVAYIEAEARAAALDVDKPLLVAALRYYADTMPGYAAAAGLTQEEYAAVMVDVRKVRAAIDALREGARD